MPSHSSIQTAEELYAGLLLRPAALAVTALTALDLAEVQIHGFVSQGWMRTTNTDWFGPSRDCGTLSFRLLDRVELSLSRQLRFANRDKPGQHYARVWAVAGRYDILENWLVKAEWQHHRGDALDTGSDEVDTWTILALITTVDF